jgi:hypothetical protein
VAHRQPRRIALLCLLALAGNLLVAASAAFAASEPLAIVASTRGEVLVTSSRGGKPVKAAFGRALQKGDKVSVSPGGAATLFFNDGNVIELGERSSVTVGGKVGAKGQAVAPELPSEVYSQVTRFVTGGSRETGLVALSTLRGESDGTPLILSPRSTDVLETRPLLRWRAVEGAQKYRVILTGEQGEVWRRDATGTELSYPADAAPLGPDADYLWEVQAFSGQAKLRGETSGFHVLPPAQVEAVRLNLSKIEESAGATSPAACFLAGSYLYGRGLYQDAAAQFERLKALDPDSPASHEAMGKVYRAVGLMDLAAAEFQQALALTREP